jgi:O-antigen/teichoic acid export membrane protein
VIAQRLPRGHYDRGVAQTVLIFANRINGSRIVNLAGAYAPDLLLGFFAGAASTASYRFANRIVVGVSDMFFGPVAKQAWVSLAAHPEDAAARGRIWSGLLQILALIVWPALWGIATLSQGLVDLLAGPSWHDAAPVIVLLAMARALLVFEVFFEPLLGVRNRATTVFQMRCLLAGLSVGAFLLLARFGAMGGGVCQILICLASAVISIRTSLQETSLSLAHLVWIMIPPAVGGMLAVIASLLASNSVQGYPLGVRITTAVLAAIVLWGLGIVAVERKTTLLRPLRMMS